MASADPPLNKIFCADCIEGMQQRLADGLIGVLAISRRPGFHPRGSHGEQNGSDGALHRHQGKEPSMRLLVTGQRSRGAQVPNNFVFHRSELGAAVLHTPSGLALT